MKISYPASTSVNGQLERIIAVLNRIDGDNFVSEIDLSAKYLMPPRMLNSLIAKTDNLYDLGTALLRWRNLYINGIVFPTTQNPNTDVHTLDDYEEGTWTPTIGGTATYTLQYGRYVKIGKWIFIQGRLTVLLLGTGSTTTISGLPFYVSYVNTGSVSYFANLATNVLFIGLYVNATAITFVSATIPTTSCINAPAIFGNGADVCFSAHYETTT